MLDSADNLLLEEDAMAEAARPVGQLVSGLERIQACYEAAIEELEAALSDFLEQTT
jgi:hypothetical protein